MVRCRCRQELAAGLNQDVSLSVFEDHGALSGCSEHSADLGRGRRPEPANGRARVWHISDLGLTATLLAALVLFNPLIAHSQASPAPQAQAPSSSASSSASASQSTPANGPPTGITAFVQTQYSANLIGTVLVFDADLGYGLTNHLSADIGVPVIFTRNPFSPVTDHDYYWSALLGEPYLDLKYTGTYHAVSYTSVLTGTGPVASEDRIYTTGRFGVDWFNHMEEQVGPIVPFLNIEGSNGAVNRFVMPRPFEEARLYQSLGLLGDAEGGFEYTINNRFVRGVKIGASAYLQAGGGPQKMYSRLVFPYSSLAGDGHHDRYWDSSFETVGSSVITRDNGFSVWMDLKPLTNIDAQLGYTRSVHYDMDMYTAMFNFDLSQFIKPLFRRR